MPSFHDFSLQPATLALLAQMNIAEPTPIQAEAIPALLAGNDLVGQSATGSGKTLAYGIPLVERLASNKRAVQALVLVPTRELATQVNAVLSKLAATRRMTTALLVGGKAYGKQIAALRFGAQIVVGTPGRVKDLLDHGSLTLHQTRVCVLDEADQMLDIGFAPVIEEILAAAPETRQMALFSATMPDWVAKLEQKFLTDPVKVVITPATGGQSTIEQIAYQVPQAQKMAALCTLLQSAEGESTLIFGRTKFGVEKLGQQLSKLGFTVGTLHGNKSQRAREDVLAAFRRGHVQTLLATNVAARGLDIQGIYQVINYELPESSELFTHRIGRTGRMGRQGKAITLLAPADVSKWRRMARSLGQDVLLHKLTIDENAAVVPQSATASAPALLEFAAPQERAPRAPRTRQNDASTRERPAYNDSESSRGRRSFAADPEREPYRVLWPKRDLQVVNSEFTEDEPYREQRPARSRKPAARGREMQNEQLPPRGFRPAATEQEYEQYGDFRPTRRRTPVAGEQERRRSPRPGTGRYEAATPQRPARPSAWQANDFAITERPTSGKRPGAGKPSGFAKRKAATLATPNRANGNKPARRSAGR
ncbi:MAG TPA: DEAD/DEAH box helicase [Ktedonobacteraceae bacterium]